MRHYNYLFLCNFTPLLAAGEWAQGPDFGMPYHHTLNVSDGVMAGEVVVQVPLSQEQPAIRPCVGSGLSGGSTNVRFCIFWRTHSKPCISAQNGWNDVIPVAAGAHGPHLPHISTGYLCKFWWGFQTEIAGF